MLYPTNLTQPAVLMLALCVFAPAAMAADEGNPTPIVMTDTAPLPAQDRGSMGAIIMDGSMVLAQRAAFQKANDRTGLATIGKNALRTTLRAKMTSELADARRQDALLLQDRGASSLDEK